MKKVLSLAMVVVMAMSVMMLTACGVDKDAVKGTWKLDKANDMSVADYAASLGTTEDQVNQQIEVTDDKAKFKTPQSEDEYDIEWGSDGFIAKTGDVAGDVGYVYDADAKTLTAKYDVAGTNYTFVYVKGSVNFDAAPAEGGEEEAVEGEEAAEGEEAVEGEEAAEGEEDAAVEEGAEEGEEAAE